MRERKKVNRDVHGHDIRHVTAEMLSTPPNSGFVVDLHYSIACSRPLSGLRYDSSWW